MWQKVSPWPSGSFSRQTDSVGPPEHGVFHGDLARFAHGEEHVAVRGGDGDGDPGVGIRAAVKVGVHAEDDPAALVSLADVHVADAGVVHAEEHDVAPDTAVGQPGTPVPAEHAVGLADLREALHGVGGALHEPRGVGLADEAGGGGEGHGDGVFPLMEQGFHVELPGAVHVVRLADARAVQVDGRQRVQALAAQEHLVALEEVRGD